MNTITHALLPVIAASLIERVDRCSERKGIFSTREILVLGFFGAAPDLLNPHLSLEARYTSWSHGLPFWAVLTIALLVASLFLKKRFPPRMVVLCSAAYLLHLVCDLIAGGLAWLYPWRGDIVGEYFVPPQWWAWIDVACILAVYGFWRVAPHFHQSHETKM